MKNNLNLVTNIAVLFGREKIESKNDAKGRMAA
jgi:hypothetical protein